MKSQDLRTSSGRPTWATYSFINSLATLTAKYEPTHLLVAWDRGRSVYRSQKLSTYKANRKKTAALDELDETNIPLQRQDLQQLLTLMGVPQWTEDGVEADDIIATICKRYFGEVIIVSADHDLRQLVTDKVTVLKPGLGGFRPTKEVVYDLEKLQEEFGDIPPHRLPEIWALEGDQSDNIPGIPKVGPKTALKWITKYGSLQAVLEQEPKAREFHDQVLLAYDLIQLRGDLSSVPLSLEELEFKPVGPESSELMDKLDEFEMSAFKQRLGLGLMWKDNSFTGRKLALSEQGEDYDYD